MFLNNLFPGLLAEFPMLSQAAAPPEKVTAGTALAGFLVLGVMASSVWMIIVWVGRRNLTGHALPAARRGILRVPPVLTFVGIGLSLMMFMLMMLVSLQEKPGAKPAPNPATPPVAVGAAETPASTTEPAAAESSAAVEQSPPAEEPPAANSSSPETTPAATSATSDKPKKKKSAASQMSPEDMQSALLQTVVMDAFLFLVFGVVVFISRQQGRVRLTESSTFVPATQAYQAAMYSSSNFWPDLDDPSAAPVQPGYSLPVERSALPPAIHSSADSSEESVSPRAASQAEGHVVSAAETVAPGEPDERVIEPDEPFSFLTELRYAAEVFLAAYVPTAMLRVLVVVLTEGLTGEVPDQHPFLEMMESDVGMAVLSLIVLTAVILAPIVEELQFRVVILGGIAQLGRSRLALVVSSVLFAFAHGFPDSLALLPLAFALGYTYQRRRSYITVMMVHFLFNAFNMALAFASMF